MTLTIVSLLPSLQNTNGDAENAAVLAARARWAGLDARVVAVEQAADLPERVDAVVLGSGSDASLDVARERLLALVDELRRWGTEGVPILAVGTGWELLSWGIERADGSTVEGLGIVAGRGVPREHRIAGDLVVQVPRIGLLVGFENHARDYVGAEASPLGRVRAGTGNGRRSGQEGVRMGDVIGTHLHGPVLAKNPVLADAILRRMCERAGLEYAPGARTAEVDGYAETARQAQLRAAGVNAAV
ncbi:MULTISPECIES: type 1 glutamine amidotransferase [Agromyces]|uniref:Lipid II isoglutaminyl synthase (glutamine-hydrolyzing) subunit GatD n=1 Tax=Agromyces indicus TaxID=758919 RepID=A0ABU1FQ89_9MICO|nr:MULTISPECIES: cobyric acid synthase [Agromyces]MCK8609399.1 cobyric acid synthase [Agromyces sp. C10]MDR5693551.1 cobyric acid synthase [Agromyces indicus]